MEGWRRLQVPETEPRVLGLPRSWFGPARRQGTGAGHRFLRHPLTWARWRILLRREGPYAPELEELLSRGGGRPPSR